MKTKGTFLFWLVALLAPLTGCLKEDESSNIESLSTGWELVFQEDFSDDSSLRRWKLEGFAGLEIVRRGDTDYLKITTTFSETDRQNKQSVLWCRERLSGDLRFVFRARGETVNRSIFYFNANPTPGSGFSSIFHWQRPDARMIRYAGSDSIEMYSVGMLRDDQEVCNLRYIGGTAAPAYRDPQMHKNGQILYGSETIFKAFDSPFLNKPDTWFEFDLRIVGRRVSLEVDGVTVFDVEDPGNVGTGKFAWKPLTGGGFCGFRNFVPGAVCVDYLKVYRKK